MYSYMISLTPHVVTFLNFGTLLNQDRANLKLVPTTMSIVISYLTYKQPWKLVLLIHRKIIYDRKTIIKLPTFLKNFHHFF